MPWFIFAHTCTLPAGDIGDVEELPEGTESLPNPNTFRIRPRGQDVPSTPSRDASRDEAAAATPGGSSAATQPISSRLCLIREGAALPCNWPAEQLLLPGKARPGMPMKACLASVPT
jgi:hypothetical protein